jgi:predicted nucleotidyltransferase
VIEEPINECLDISGWELRKTLRLLRKSNPPLLEWLKSPVVYAWDEQFVSDFKQLADEYYSPARCFQHYLHMAFGNARDCLKHDQVWFKKYLYVLRPLLACRWIERNMGQVPMLFDELVEGIVEDADVLIAIQNLLTRKKAGDELDRGPKDAVLSAYIDGDDREGAAGVSDGHLAAEGADGVEVGVVIDGGLVEDAVMDLITPR